MMYQYQCACCNNKALSSHDKACSKCGSHHIKSPVSLWIFCIFACFAVAITIKLVHIYVQDHQDTPTQSTLLDVLNHDKDHSSISN
ncbi:hypothetical protein [Acinetobacter sp. ANC 3832]|uniref:hypothetical protein n=1 Tax=Acinetobacter sp. ANC 3832 TaxID=1977874 RepID=UPI000A33CFAC|nr:hypothetical protein [Acinetobacter sp. ANC 3832]OTG94681.1 hypothetical protein B9T35_04685 [Acinetobacter sp. ANC 3832]